MKLWVVVHALGRTASQFVKEKGVSVRPFGITRFGHFVVRQAIFQGALA